MNRKIIAVDIDDVLADSSEALRLFVNKRLGVNLKKEHYQIPGDYWSHYEKVWAQHGLSDRITLKELEPVMETNQRHVAPYQGALQTLHALRERFQLVIITSRPSSWRQATTEWLNEHYPDLFTRVLFTDEVRDGEQPQTKGQLCVDNNVAWLIDDNVEHALSAEELGVKVVVFGTYGWHHKVPPHMTRCKDWPAVLEYFRGQK